MRCSTIAIGTALLALAAVPAWLLLKHQPGFYDRCAVPEGDDRSALSSDFANRYGNLMDGGERPSTYWQEVFTTAQINSFLQHDYLAENSGFKKLPDGFRDVRIQVEEGLLRIGCRYGGRIGGTILSFEAKMWLVEHEVNVIAVELANMHAGALPVPRKVILDYISEACARSKIAVSWHYIDDNPVAYLRLQADKEHPTIHIERLELHPGRIVISGRTIASEVAKSTGEPAKQ